MDQLEERLVKTIHRYHRRGVEFHVTGMSRGKFMLVAAAWQIYSESADQKVRVSDLVSKMGIPAPGVSRILRGLQEYKARILGICDTERKASFCPDRVVII